MGAKSHDSRETRKIQIYDGNNPHHLPNHYGNFTDRNNNGIGDNGKRIEKTRRAK
jgi:hypothetical protein